MADDVAIRLKLQGAAEVARGSRQAADAITGIGLATRGAGAAARGFGSAIDSATTRAGRGFGALARQARYANIGLGLLAGAGARWGIGFNAQVESSEVALTTLLGSQRKAHAELLRGQGIAKASALLNFRDTARAQQQLIGMGVNAGRTRKLLQGTSDALVALGRDPQEFQQVINAFSQIQAKGTVMGDEITQQLGEVFPAMQILSDELGLTGKQMRNLGAEGITATTALDALAHGLEKRYGGAAKNAASTWTAQMARLKDNTQQALGALTKPAFDWTEKAVLPAANRAAQAISEIFGEKGLSDTEKLRRARGVIERELGPIGHVIEQRIAQAHIPEALGHLVGLAIPKMADAAGEAGPAAAKAFITGWMNSGPWGQFLTVLLLGSKTGAFGALGKALGKRGAGGAGGLGGFAQRGSTPANPVWVAPVGGGLPGGAPGKVPVPGRAARIARRVLPIAGPVGAAFTAGELINAAAPHFGDRDLPTRGLEAGRRAQSGHVGFLPGPQALRRVTSTPSGVHVVVEPQPVTLNIDGRPVAQVIATANARQRARR